LVSASSDTRLEDIDLIKRILIPMLALAFPVFAQPGTPAQPSPVSQSATKPVAAAAADDAKKAVAVVNGETITVEKLNRMYNNLSTQMRVNYDANGGKGAFLENYIRKRLVIQEAFKSGFNRQPDVAAAVEAAQESALFDRYVRDVIAAPIVTENDLKTYYNDHPDDFATPERVHVRHIVVGITDVGPSPKTKEQALEQIQKIATELRAADVASAQTKPDPATLARLKLAHFAEAAKKYSEDSSAENGGDLGWITKGQTDPTFESAAWSMKPGTVSGIVLSKFGYHLIMVVERQAPGTEPYEAVKAGLREYLVTQKAADVVTTVSRLTNELRGRSRISVFPENIK
jgi:EpsD family peptidyl-prolyl cis-trans isomerase